MSDQATDPFKRAAIPPMRASVSPVTTSSVGSAPRPAGVGAGASAAVAPSSTHSMVDTMNNTKVSVGSVILIVIACLVLFLVVYKVYDIVKKTSLKKEWIRKPMASLKDPQDLATNVKLSDPLVGREYTLSFWFWLDGSDVSISDKMLLDMGGIYTFAIRNHTLVFKANQVAGSSAPAVTETFPVAIQKWTHIMMVVDNNYVTVYKDGDVAISRGIAGSFQTVPKTYLVTGALTGFLSGMCYYNYVTNAKDVRKAYGKGPMSAGLLRFLGMPMYGVRNPFYRIDGVSDLK